MAWYKFKNKKSLQEIDVEEKPASKRTNTNDQPIKINKNKIKDFIIKSVSAITSQSDSRERFVRPEYDLWEIKEASEADSYIKISFSKYSYLIYKAGASIKGEDSRVEYLQKRLRMMSFMTQKPIDILFQEVADDLVKYSNAFLIKKRINVIPGIKAKPAFADKVVGGYFRADPASVRIKRDKTGNVLKYEQGYGENMKEFFPRDILHLYLDKDANNAFGTPRIIAALEDVRLLRRIEGNISALIYRFSMPVYQWMIGLPQAGMQGTDPEIKKAEREIEMSSLDGIVVTNERTTIKAIGAEGNALNAEGYLKYFEERVFSALGVSASQMGRGGAKQDSESMEAQVHDTVKYIQRVMSIFIKEGIFTELLLEGGYNPIINEEDIVDYEFEEISLETKVKKENHEMLKYQSNVTTLEESRRRMGMKDEAPDEERLYKNLIEKNSRLAEIDRTAKHQIDLANVNAKNSKDLAKEQAKTKDPGSVANKSPRNSKSSNPSKAVSTNNRPENQHGTHSAKIKESLDLDPYKYKENFSKVFEAIEDAKNDIKNGEAPEIILPLILENMTNEANKIIQDYSEEAIKDACGELSKELNRHVLLPYGTVSLSKFNDDIEKEFGNILKTIEKETKKTDKSISDVFDYNENKIRYLLDHVTRKTYWYSYIKTGQKIGVEKAYIIFSSEKDAKNNKDVVDTNLFSIDDIPSYHSFCNCKVTYNKEKVGEKNGNRN